jgi:uncharacterized protein (TIGR03435 family)
MGRLFVPVFMALCLSAQQPARDPAFEVASVKPSAPHQNGFSIDTSGDTLTMRNVTLRIAIQFAYRLHEYQLTGEPKWATSDGYDIIGKADASMGALSQSERADRFRAMLRTLLAERFQLTLHREVRDVPAYKLSIAKAGFVLKPVEPGGANRTYGTPEELVAQGSNVANFVSLLAAHFQIPVVDTTGLQGLYDFRVHFAPDSVPDSPLPSFFTAIQEQCGLKIERSTAPSEVFSIERVERPSAN